MQRRGLRMVDAGCALLASCCAWYTLRLLWAFQLGAIVECRSNGRGGYGNAGRQGTIAWRRVGEGAAGALRGLAQELVQGDFPGAVLSGQKRHLFPDDRSLLFVSSSFGCLRISVLS